MTKEKQNEAKKMAKAMARASLMVAINATKLSGDAMGIGNRVYLDDKAKAFKAFEDALDPFLCWLTDKEVARIFNKYEQEVASYESSMA